MDELPGLGVGAGVETELLLFDASALCPADSLDAAAGWGVFFIWVGVDLGFGSLLDTLR